MGPPGLTATPRAGGTTTRDNALTGSQIQLVLRAAHAALAASGIDVGPSKVTKVVRRFSHALKRSGLTFHEFLTDQANHRRLILIDPELARVIAYADPTGETAVRNVIRGGAGDAA